MTISKIYTLQKKNYILYFVRCTLPIKRYLYRKTKEWTLRKDDAYGAAHLLGSISFRTGWRQYVFTAEPKIDMSLGCLKFISAFLEYQNSKRIKELKSR